MYLLKRLIQIAVSIALLSVILFYLLHAMPGDPSDQFLLSRGTELSAADLSEYRRSHSLDRSTFERYVCWLRGRSAPNCELWSTDGILSGDMGRSSAHQILVSEIFTQRLGLSLRLMLPAFFIALFFALLIGIWSAHRKDQRFDRFVLGLSFGGLAFPVHCWGLLALFVFAVLFPLFPVGGVNDVRQASFLSGIHHSILPIAVLSFFYFSRWVRHVRNQVIEVLNSSFILAARANGLSRNRILFVHALSAAALPILTVIGHSVPSIFAGAVVTEKVFSYPGIGTLLLESIQSDDQLLAMTILLVFAVVSFVCTLLIDMAYQYLDPRIRLGDSL